jgi:hypothetical protein
MCHFTEDCDGGEEYIWENEPIQIGGAALGAFGCDKCGYSNCL